MASDTNTIFVLVQLVAGQLSAGDWIKWWSENNDQLSGELPRSWYLKIKPKLGQGDNGAALISQNAASAYPI